SPIEVPMAAHAPADGAITKAMPVSHGATGPKSGSSAKAKKPAVKSDSADAPNNGEGPWTFLFVTKPDYTPERVESGECGSWSCAKDTRLGDTILCYVTGEGIRYQWQATSDATPDDDPQSKWPYFCDIVFEKAFDPPIHIREIKEVITKEEWGALGSNF